MTALIPSRYHHHTHTHTHTRPRDHHHHHHPTNTTSNTTTARTIPRRDTTGNLSILRSLCDSVRTKFEQSMHTFTQGGQQYHPETALRKHADQARAALTKQFEAGASC